MPDTKKHFERYGLLWPLRTDPLKLEFYMIQHGGRIVKKDRECGLGLFHHYREAQRLLWPEDDHHRWSDLILKNILEQRVTVVFGPKDTSKTRTASKYGLTDYWCFPNNTLVLVSSTEQRGMELRVWGDMKQLFARAKERHEWLAGSVVDSKHGIFTDQLGDNCEVRDQRKGVICVPCMAGNGEWIGIEKWCGIKQDRRRLLADEFQFMKAPYLNSMEHLDKGDYKFVGLANPIAQGDPADKVGEPVAGWGSEPESEKTESWKNRWGGITINFDGRDTPNNDEPKNRYSYLISQEDIDRTANRRGTDSSPYWTQVIGKRKVGLDSKRVLTRMICLNFGAFEPVIWAGSATTKIFAIDASYGGDRCMAGWIEFGLDVKNKTVLSFETPYEIPILVSTKEMPEDQIASRVRRDCEAQGIPPSNVFFDSTGRGSLGTSFSRLWSADVNPVEFGGNPTSRPVAQTMFIRDDKTGQRRLKRCDEHYSKLVTEYWFSVRYAVEARQVRGLPEICAEEFGMREWMRVKGNKIELEKKEETKERLGCSPDAADWAAIAVEGARRLGFTIDGLVDESSEIEDDDWLRLEHEKHLRFLKKSELSYR